MTREHKLALIVGFSLVLVLGVLISDHFSKARQVEMAEDIKPASASQMGAISPGSRMTPEPAMVQVPSLTPATRGSDGLETLPNLPGTGLALGGAGGGISHGPSSPLVLTDVRGGLPLPLGDSHPSGPGNVTLPTQPQTPPVPASQIPMTKYDIHEGDTLYRIANKFYGDGKLWEKVRDCNKDKVGPGGELHEGVTLLLPPKDVLLGKPYTPPAPPTTITVPGGKLTTPNVVDPAMTKTAAKQPGDFKEYVVKEGDTLVAIAKKTLNSGKRYTEIIEANKGTLSDPESLSVGMKLRIPSH